MDFEIRPYRPEDQPAVLRVLEAGMPADPISTARFTRQVLLDPNFRAEGLPVAIMAGEVAGCCLALSRHVPLENAPPDSARGYVTLIAVMPDARRRGMGSRMLDAAEDYLRRQGRSEALVSPYAPGYFLPGVDVQAYEGALGFFTSRGYSEVYQPLAMETSLWDTVRPEWVVAREAELVASGIRFERYSPELTLPLLEFAAREFAGDWVRVVRESAARILAGDNPDRLFAAHLNGRVLGFVHHENERFGPIGVAAEERGRGLGQVLMFRALDAMRAAGFRTAWFLWSDDRTARRIYDCAGFREVRRFAVLRKALEE